MSNEPTWPVAAPGPLSRLCADSGGGGGSSRAGVWDSTALLRTLRGNTQAAARVARAFLDDYPRVAQSLRDAVRDGDSDAVERLAHRMKGNAGILRARAVQDAAQKLERIAGAGNLASAGDRLVALEHDLSLLCSALGGFLAAAGTPAPD